MNTTSVAKMVAAAIVSVGLAANSHAQTVGAGTGILALEGANNTVDTPSNGTNDQSRQNVDISFTATLGPGSYSASTWTYQAGNTGSVTPYLAFSTGDHSYEIIAVGDQVDIVDEAGQNVDVTVPFGGSSCRLMCSPAKSTDSPFSSARNTCIVSRVR